MNEQDLAVSAARSAVHVGVASSSDVEPVAARARLAPIDLLRGLAIALMVLDHVRDFFTNPQVSPTDLGQTTPALFLTRWITHYCAPIFVFLAGTSAFLASSRLSRRALTHFLLTRGLWLIALEFSVVNFVWHFNFDYSMGLVMQVIWAIGCSMCVLSGLVWLPRWALASVSVLGIAGHNLLDALEPSRFGAFAPVWKVLHVQSQIPGGFVVYPLIPWVFVMALGFVFGALYELPAPRRRALTLRLGVSASLGFMLLRFTNVYGDPQAWSAQSTFLYTLLSFLNVSKYPPSLLYLLMTLGPACILLVIFERKEPPMSRALITFGRVPLFAYVVHIALAHLAAGWIGVGFGHGTEILAHFPFGYPASWGFGLPIVYVAWLGVLLVLYAASAWFAGIKARHQAWWLKYL